MTAPSLATRVGLEEFVARCDALGVPSRFAIAVSGGRDSMALAALAALYSEKAGAEVLALTVDHGLRAGSAEEAQDVAGWCEALGLAHETLLWEGKKPTSGVQAAARHSRYRLLAEACEARGVDALLTAHTADDQAETVLMRLARGGGVRGLSGMAAETLIAAGGGAPIRLLRPLLNFSRARMTATVEAAGVLFIDDPSNEDTGFERIRMRKLLAELEAQGDLTKDALVQTAVKMQKTRALLEERELALFERADGAFFEWGGARLDMQRTLPELTDPAIGSLTTRILQAVAGAPHRADEEAASAALHDVIHTGAATLGGVLMKLRKDQIWFVREPAAVFGREGVAPLAPKMLEPGARLLFDRRFVIENKGAEALEICPLGRDRSQDVSVGLEGPKEALWTLPGVFRGSELIGVGGLGAVLGGPECAIKALPEQQFRLPIIRF